MLLACLCLFFLVNLTEFRWGALQIEQAREVLTKLERKVNLFLSLAKEPFSKTPPNTDKIAFIPLFPFWAIMTSVFSILLFLLTPDLYFFLLHFFQNCTHLLREVETVTLTLLLLGGCVGFTDRVLPWV